VKKPFVSLVALAIITLALAGCDSTRGSALTVGNREVSQSSIDRELDAIADNEVLAEQAETAGAGAETLNPQITAFWLTLRVQQEVIDREVRDRDLEVTQADREAGLAAIEGEIGPDVFEAFPQWLQDRLEDRYARRAALLRDTGGGDTGPTEEEVMAAYEETLAQARAQCASGKFAAHILVATADEANQIATELAAGADFAELARTRSQDQGSAEVGGQLFCFDAAQYVPEFATAADALPLGQVSAPVQTEFGFHIILMSDTVPLAAVEERIRESLAPATGTNPEIDELVADAKVRVNPRYGTWEVAEGIGAVQPPDVPEGAPTTTPTVPAPAPAPAP
jgi:parvulin-like peptidyl-prolyl isomerase